MARICLIQPYLPSEIGWYVIFLSLFVERSRCYSVQIKSQTNDLKVLALIFFKIQAKMTNIFMNLCIYLYFKCFKFNITSLFTISCKICTSNMSIMCFVILFLCSRARVGRLLKYKVNPVEIKLIDQMFLIY